MVTSRTTSVVAVAAAVIAAGTTARAGPVLLGTIDPSTRAAGMGLSSGAVFWGRARSTWANPGLASVGHGIRLDHQKHVLWPRNGDGVAFSRTAISVAWHGIGMSAVGVPGTDLSGSRLSYGDLVSGGTIGGDVQSFEPVETSQAWTLGISASAVAALARWCGLDLPDVSRIADVHAGYAWKNIELDLVPPWRGGPSAVSGTSHDRGLLFWVDVGNLIEEVIPGLDGVTPRSFGTSSLELGYGTSCQNASPRRFDVAGDGHGLAHLDRDGWAATIALGSADSFFRWLEERGWGWMSAHGEPMVRLGWSTDRVVARIPDGDDWLRMDPVRGMGWEVELVGCATLRWGRGGGTFGNVEHVSTIGWGVRIPIQDRCSVEYSRSEVPHGGPYISSYVRHGVAVTVHP